MKRTGARATARLVLATLLMLATSSALAHASASFPALGTWRGTAKGSSETFGFVLRRSRAGAYQAGSTRVSLTARCSSDSDDPTQPIAARGITVKLKRSGGRLRGVRRYEYFDPDQANVAVRIGIEFRSSVSAVVTLRATYQAEEQRDETNNYDCSRRLRLTARHR